MRVCYDLSLGIPTMSELSEKAWSILSQIKEEDHFIRSFNGLDENKRREVADYVLTHCNVFSGKGSAFSARYSNVSGLLE